MKSKIDYEASVKTFFESVRWLLVTNARRVKPDARAEIMKNLGCVKEISRLPHRYSDYRVRERSGNNPSKVGFVRGQTNVYDEFLTALNGINVYCNSDLPNKGEVFNKSMAKWHNALSGNRIKTVLARVAGQKLVRVR